MTDRIRLAGLVATEAAVVVGLHSLARLDAFGIPWSDLGSWLDRSPFEEVVGAVLLVVALVLAYWLLISTVSYLVVALSGHGGLIGAVDRLTVPAIRSLARRAIVLSLAASTVTGPLAPAGASDRTGSALPERVEVGEGGQVVPRAAEVVDEVDDARTLLPPHLEPGPPPPTAEVSPGAAPADPTAVDGTVAHTVTVRRGDHMWSLAESHLARVTGRNDLGDHEIARYWRHVIDENRPRIKSGNPDLIYPGEALVLPAVER